MLCRAVAFGGAVCVLGIRPYATRAPLDDLGYRMLDTRNFVVPNVNGYVCVDDGGVCAYVTNDVRSE